MEEKLREKVQDHSAVVIQLKDCQTKFDLSEKAFKKATMENVAVTSALLTKDQEYKVMKSSKI